MIFALEQMLLTRIFAKLQAQRSPQAAELEPQQIISATRLPLDQVIR